MVWGTKSVGIMESVDDEPDLACLPDDGNGSAMMLQRCVVRGKGGVEDSCAFSIPSAAARQAGRVRLVTFTFLG